MGSVTDNGSISEDDPRYKEGYKIIGFNNESKCDDSAEDQKLIEYLPESSREHEVIGKWLSLVKEREKGDLPIDNNCFNNVSGKLDMDNDSYLNKKEFSKLKNRNVKSKVTLTTILIN